MSAHAAAALGLTDALRDIVRADPSRTEARDDDADTPLMAACAHGRTEAARVLLANGADPNAANRWDETALTRSVTRADLPTIELLLTAGADPSKGGRGGRQPVDHIATPDESVARRVRNLLGA